MRNPSLAVIMGLLASLASAASIDSEAPAFQLPNLHNQTRTLAQFKGRVVVINFWASWCAPCREELPQLNRLAGDYPARKVQVLALNVDKNRADARALLEALQLLKPRMEILWDSQNKVVSRYQAEAMPASFIVDGHGRIRFIHAGYRSGDAALWRREIDHLLAPHGR